MANDKNTDNFIKKQFSYLIKSKVNTRMGNLKPSPFIHFLNEFRQGTKKAPILNLLIFHNLRCHLKLINIFIFYILHLLFQVLRRRHYCDLNISKDISFFLLTLYLSDIPPHLHHWDSPHSRHTPGKTQIFRLKWTLRGYLGLVNTVILVVALVLVVKIARVGLDSTVVLIRTIWTVGHSVTVSAE